jgi:PPOX class probable F420-dependent enzyme
MPGYGLAGPDEGELLPWSWAHDKLVSAHVYWLATAGADGRPHLAAVWGLWADGALHVSTGGASRKARDVAHEPRVSVSVDGGVESLVVDGVAERVTDPDRLAAVSRRYVDKYGEGYPDPAENPLLAIAPRRVVAVLETAFTDKATRWTFAPGEVPPA